MSLISELAQWFETEPSPEFERFVLAHLDVAKRIWRREHGERGPEKTFTASSEIGTNLRWFYLPDPACVFRDNGWVWVQGSTGDVWGWDERVYPSTVPSREKPCPLAHTVTVSKHEWGRTDLQRVVPRTLSRRTDRHSKVGFSADLEKAACEPGMAYYVDAEKLLAAVRVMDPIFSVGVGLMDDELALMVRDRYRFWTTSVTASEAVT